MQSLTDKEIKKLERALNIELGGTGSFTAYLLAVEERLEEALSQLEAIKGRIEAVKDGKDYVLTESDRKEIAEKVTVPVVEKVIEKTEVIREKPIVTNQIVKETVETFDSSEIENKLEDLSDELDALKKKPVVPVVLGGRAGPQILSSNTKVGPRANEINFGTGFTVADEYGRITVEASASGFSLLTATGTVDGSNKDFTFTSAPSIIVVDQGRQMQQTSSDGTVNWTGTTSVSLTVAPNFDVYGL